MPKNITFNQLKSVMGVRVGRPGLPSKAALYNANTALGKFCRAIRLDMNARVGQSLRDDYEESLRLYRDQLQRSGNSRETSNNKVSSMNSWARLIRELDHEGASERGDVTPFQAKLNELFDSRKDMFSIAKRSRVSWRTLRNWKNGAMPKSTSDDALRRLAVSSGLMPDALIKLLPFAVGRNLPTGVPVIKISHREEHAELCRKPYLWPVREATDAFKNEWRGLLRYKVAAAKDIRDDEPARKLTILDEMRAARASIPTDRDRVWRTRPVEDYVADFPAWVNIIGGLVAPSAGMNFKGVVAFLGWLRLPLAEGGRAVPDELLSMGHLVDAEACEAYIDWFALRVESVNAGTTGWIVNMRSLMRAKTGYLWLSTAIGRRMNYDEATWRSRCEAVNAHLGLRNAQYSAISKPRRKPERPIKPLLDMPRPLAPFRDAISMYAKQVRSNDGERATQSRDLALLAVSISNPLRLTNLRLLSYKPDNSGHFRKNPLTEFGWEIFVPKEELKNIRGAAKDEDYRMPMSEMAAHYLEEYMAKWWKTLGGPGSRGLVFIAQGSPDSIWRNLNNQYADVTRRILAPYGCPSIRTHATRYLVGTAILMATQGNVQLAAKALHDMPYTVEKHYKKLLGQYGARGVNAVIGKDMRISDEVAGLITIPGDDPASEFVKKDPTY